MHSPDFNSESENGGDFTTPPITNNPSDRNESQTARTSSGRLSATLSPDPESEKWDKFAKNYDEKVFSITKIPEKRQRIIDRIKDGDRVLIVGCGSATYLQEDILRQKTVEIVATDFSDRMLQASKTNFTHEDLTHHLEDTRELAFPPESFDIVISTNSIIPEDRKDIPKMYKAIRKALKNGGILVLYLPSFDAGERFAEQYHGDLKIEIDKTRLRIWDTTGWQCFHTIESTTNDLKTAGFEHIEILEVPTESEMEANELARIYSTESISKEWQIFFVTAR